MILAVIQSSCSKTERTQEKNVPPTPPDPFPIELHATLGDFNINGDVANSELSFSVKTNEPPMMMSPEEILMLPRYTNFIIQQIIEQKKKYQSYSWTNISEWEIQRN